MGEYYDEQGMFHQVCEICDDKEPRTEILYINLARTTDFARICEDREMIARARLIHSQGSPWVIVVACKDCAAKDEVKALLYKE